MSDYEELIRIRVRLYNLEERMSQMGIKVQLVGSPRNEKGEPQDPPLPEKWHISVDGAFICNESLKAPMVVIKTDTALPFGSRPCSSCVNTLLRAIDLWRR